MCGHYRKPLSWLIDTDAVILKSLLFFDGEYSVESKKGDKKGKKRFLPRFNFASRPPTYIYKVGGGAGGGRMEAVLGNLAVLLFLCVLVGSRLTELTNQAQKKPRALKVTLIPLGGESQILRRILGMLFFSPFFFFFFFNLIVFRRSDAPLPFASCFFFFFL